MHDMQNPDGIFFINPIHDDEFLHGETIESSAKVVLPPPANVGILTQQANGLHEPVDKAVGVQFAVIGDMAPNGQEIATRALSKPVTRR